MRDKWTKSFIKGVARGLFLASLAGDVKTLAKVMETGELPLEGSSDVPTPGEFVSEACVLVGRIEGANAVSLEEILSRSVEAAGFANWKTYFDKNPDTARLMGMSTAIFSLGEGGPSALLGGLLVPPYRLSNDAKQVLQKDKTLSLN